MSGINSAIRITDGMSPALKSMNKALNIVLNSFEKVQKVSGNAIDVSDIRDARTELANAAIAVNNLESELKQAENAQEKLTKETKRTESAMGGLVNQALGLVATYASFQGLMGAVNLSDRMSQTSSRLSLIVDVDENASRAEIDKATKELEDKIFASANRSRSAYLDTAATVAAFAQRAGDAFSGNDEVIAFTETLNKMYVIAGATAEEQSSSMLQLTQALGSGVLRGEEFNAVFEAAPNIMQAVAKYMNVPIGQLRSMAEEGKITADIVKNAIFDATNDVNEDFENMKWTWQQVFTSFKNVATKSLEPVLDKISELANNKDVQKFVSGAASALGKLGVIALGTIEHIAAVGSFMYENWSIIGPVIWGIIAALGVYYGQLLLVRAASLLSAAASGTMAIAKGLLAAATWATTSATWAQVTAQYGLNSAMYKCPIVWIIGLIIGLIALFYAAVGAVNKFADTSVSATGLIAGAFAGMAAYIVNKLIMIYNFLATLGNFLLNVFNNPVYSVKKLFVDLASLILDFCIAATEGFDEVATNLANAFIEGANLAIKGINWIITALNKIPGVDIDKVGKISQTASITSSMRGVKDDLNSWLGEAPDSYNEVITKMDYIDVSEWANAGYDFGAGVEDKISDVFSMDSIDALLNDANKSVLDSLGDIPEYVGDIADNTGGIADAMDITEEDLRYLRDIAEQETINRFTTAEIRIDMQNNNSIASGMDIDGIVTQLEDKLYESMEIAAEGAY